MLKSYFKTAIRSLSKNRNFTILNVLGLALGIVCTLLILLWVKSELSVDDFHANTSQLYQVYERNHYDGKIEGAYETQGLLAEELKKEIPEIQYASGMEYVAAPGTSSNFYFDGKTGKMTGFFVGEDFLRMFTYPLINGDREKVFAAPNTIVVSRKMAEFYFGSPENALGKTLRFENEEDLLVTATFENVPSNSSRQFDFLRTWSDFVKQNAWVNSWGSSSPATYVQLRKNADPEKVDIKMKDLLSDFLTLDDNFRIELALQPYHQKYLYSTFKNGHPDGGRIEYVNTFMLVAIFILLIACINFMNLATAKSSKRAKEVGLRKAIGASRFSLVRQFYFEAFLLTSISFLLGILLTFLLLPYFNELTGKTLFFPWNETEFWVLLPLIVLIISIIAGSYPALYLSSMKPIQVLKDKINFSGGVLILRKGLVVFQFTLSILFILGMIVTYQQLNYIQTKNIGYERRNLIYVPIEGNLKNNYALFKSLAESRPEILSVTKMRNSPTVIEHHVNDISWPGKDPSLKLPFADAVVGYDFVKTLNIQIIEGRDFSKDFGADFNSYLVNEVAIEKMGLKTALGKKVMWGDRQGKIIGVLKDFHFNSMHQPIDPLIVRLDENWSWGTILVRVKEGSIRSAIAGLETINKTVNPSFPFTYKFSDLEYVNLYRNEEIVGKLFSYFAFLAITISCLGLLGLAAFSSEQRTKEIGIRKVLGAKISAIVMLLSNDFLRLVIIAILIAFPIAWYGMGEWLQGFAYRIEIRWWMFVAAGVAAIIIAFATVCFQAVKAALMNPVKSLRSE